MNRITLRNRNFVLIDGEPLRLHPSLELRNHSPTGFAWGYGGSGPAQLALALLLHVTKNKEVSLRHYQAFKSEHVVTWPWENHPQEHDVDILGWIERREREAGATQDDDEKLLRKYGNEDPTERRFVLQIELSNEAMKEVSDIPDTLRAVADRVAEGNVNGIIRDLNGNTVGGFRLLEQGEA